MAAISEAERAAVIAEYIERVKWEGEEYHINTATGSLFPVPVSDMSDIDIEVHIEELYSHVDTHDTDDIDGYLWGRDYALTDIIILEYELSQRERSRT